MQLDARVQDKLSIYGRATIKPTPEELCADAPDLVQEVREHIRQIEGMKALNELRPPGEAPAQPARAAAPRAIGQYLIRRVIDEGGMGLVYEAEQQRPHRRVALKVIRQGPLSPAMRRRFEYEAEVLGRLEHPGIARIYEAGIAEGDDGDEGTPFFAMEFVEGRRLDDYLAAAKPTTDDRLKLLIRICHAVHHAHIKGVIHRDLKPANILITQDGSPKVLDFGVARMTDSDVRTTTPNTASGQLVGTLPYMAPEQAAGRVRDLDTSCDVYALGVVGYELLSGQRPYATEDRPLHEAVKVICEQEPSRLGTVSSALRGDVETVIGKALQKDKTQRYQTAKEFADDIERVINCEPIAARPPSTWYQFNKFARRNKLLVGGVATVVAVLSTATVGLGIAYYYTNLARRSEQEQRQRADLLRIDAEGKQKLALALNDFLNNDVLSAAAPDKLGRNAKLRDALDAAAQSVGKRFESSPVIEAYIRTTLGNVYDDLGEFALAETHHRRAVELRRQQYGERSPEYLRAVSNLSGALQHMARFDEAAEKLTAAIAASTDALGPEHPNTLMLEGNLAGLYLDQGRYKEAEDLFVATIAAKSRVLGPENPETIKAMGNLALLYERQGRYQEAERLQSQVVQIEERTLGPDHPDIGNQLNGLGMTYQRLGRMADAEVAHRRALEIMRRAYGNEHFATLGGITNLGVLYLSQHRLELAEPLLVEAAQSARRALGDQHPNTAACVNNLALLRDQQGNIAEAAKLYEECLAVSRKALGDAHSDTLLAFNNLGEAYLKLNRPADAEPLYAAAIEGARRTLGPNHPYLAVFLLGRVDCLIASRQYEAAEAAIVESCTILERSPDAPREYVDACVRSGAELYKAWGKPEQAAQWQAKLDALTATTQPTTAPGGAR